VTGKARTPRARHDETINADRAEKCMLFVWVVRVVRAVVAALH
jgi:hypothetical protein